jgi:alpha-beta hydrolase superfamily lysophospholipase
LPAVKVLFIVVACLASLFVLGLVVALALVASPVPPIETPRDVFDFTSLRKTPTDIDVPSLRRYPTRDGEQLAYRFYDSAADRILIFVHGSSYHGGGYHALAAAISLGGAAKVVLPNLRGQYMSGRRRGDVDYIGQYEDDLDDLIQFLRAEQHLDGPITLGGHSSGGGLAIRFAGGSHAHDVSSYLLLAPIIPRSPAVRGGTAGGWATLHWRRIYGLLALNAVGIRGFNGLPIVEFNKPTKFWDGTETLSYSYRLNASYHPRVNYQADIRALGDKALVMVGANDQAVDPEALRTLMTADAPHAEVKILPGISHFGVFSDPTALDVATAWLRSLPNQAGQ